MLCERGAEQAEDAGLGTKVGPRRLRKILAAGLAMDPPRRLASVDELLVALGNVPLVHMRRVRVAAMDELGG